jgi:hypothetical protein
VLRKPSHNTPCHLRTPPDTSGHPPYTAGHQTPRHLRTPPSPDTRHRPHRPHRTPPIASPAHHHRMRLAGQWTRRHARTPHTQHHPQCNGAHGGTSPFLAGTWKNAWPDTPATVARLCRSYDNMLSSKSSPAAPHMSHLIGREHWGNVSDQCGNVRNKSRSPPSGAPQVMNIDMIMPT